MEKDPIKTCLEQEVNLLQDLELVRDTRGHSRADCFIAYEKHIANNPSQQTLTTSTTPQAKYFVKVFSGNILEKLKNIEQVYQKLNIPTAKIITTGYFANLNKTYSVYEFITGKTLKELLRELPPADLETLGTKVGAELNKFSQITGKQTSQQEELEQELAELFTLAKQKKQEYNQTHAKKLPVVNIDRIEKSLAKLKPAIYATKPVFIHNDVNLNNIIIHEDTPYLIDTDGGKIKYRVLDFRGNCWWGWTGNNVEREQAVYRGIYRGLFQNNIPESFHQELGFAILYEFLLRIKRYENVPEQTYYSFLRWHDIVKLTNYFENYTFDWF